MHDYRLDVRMGRVSFGCDPDDLDRLVEWHRPMAERAGWRGKVVTKRIKLPRRTTQQSLAVAEANRQREGQTYASVEAMWRDVLEAAETIAQACEMADRARSSTLRAAIRYGYVSKFPDVGASNLVRFEEAGRLWAEAFAQSRNLDEAARIMGACKQTAKKARSRYGLRFGRE